MNITEKEFNQLTEHIKSKYGINLTQKKSLVLGRMNNYLIQKGFNSFSQYFEYVILDKTGNETIELINKLTTNHTFFMREADHFDYFKNKVLPELAAGQRLKRDLRIWSAGCSSGEEPYTLAMILAEFFGSDKAMWDTKILATDISTKVLDIATKGRYSNEGVDSLPEKWKKSYFRKQDEENSVLIDNIKNEVILRNFNLMDEIFPFKKKFHVIFCRNVMIYFDLKTKIELVNKFYENTEYGGYLFIGHSESINRDETKYKYIMPAVYRKD